jgi:excisionase family DNA binding protein
VLPSTLDEGEVGLSGKVSKDSFRHLVSYESSNTFSATELAVCRATVYALLERGELERVWVGRSIRIPAASLEALLTRGRR